MFGDVQLKEMLHNDDQNDNISINCKIEICGKTLFYV